MSSSEHRPVVKRKKANHPVQEHPDSAQDILWTRPGFLVRKLHQIHVAMFLSECKSFGITPVQYAILTAPAALPGLDLTSLAHEVGLDRTTTAEVVRRLEQRGLLERRCNDADKRTRHVYLTEKGKTTVAAMHADMVRAQERMLAPLTDTQKGTFMKLLASLVEANNAYSRAARR